MPKKKKCKAIEALIEEGRELASEEAGDAAIVCAAQKIEHFEIACYQALTAWARALAEDDAAGVLEDILEEEELTNEKLAEIADTTIIPDAVRADEADEEEEHETT
jgi:ferritin-like metal-binding protein YciE